MSVWARIRPRRAARQAPVAEPPPAADQPTAALRGHLAVVVEGFRGERLDLILQTITDTATRQRMAPVIVTTLGDLPFLRHVSLPLEAVWDIQPGRRDHGLLAIRQAQQLEAIVRLWQPLDVAAFTTPQGRYIGSGLRDAIQRLLTASRPNVVQSTDDSQP